MQKIPFHIISGFLGSGKTTLLKRIIEKYAKNTKICIIQNEYAPANIDGVELRQSDTNFQLLEVNNGSVFCVCLLGDFTRSLEKFIDEYQPGIIVMEASGLSDTTSVSEILTVGTIAEKIYLASNWCIVDALNFKKAGLMKQRVSHQLRMADIVVINKTDLVSNGTKQIKEEIKTINPFAEIKESTFCTIDFDLGNNPVSKFYFDKVEPMPRPEINSMVIKSSKKISLISLEKFLNEWSPKAFRIKGFVNIDLEKTAAIQCIFDTVNIKLMDKSFHPTELVAMSSEFSLREFNQSFKNFASS